MNSVLQERIEMDLKVGKPTRNLNLAL